MTRPRDDVGSLYDWWSDHPLALRALYAVSFLGRESTFRSRAEAALDLEQGETVLEVGCGPGNSLEALQYAVGESGRVIGIDPSRGMTRRAMHHTDEANSTNTTIFRADGERLPIESNTLQAAYASMSLSAIPDPAAAIREVHRSLEPGGRFVVLDARPLQGVPGRLVNPLLVPLSARVTNWVTTVDIPGVIDDVFGDLTLETFTAGAVYIAVAKKNQGTKERRGQ